MAKFVSGVVGAGKTAALIEQVQSLRQNNYYVTVAMPSVCGDYVKSRNGKSIKVDISITDDSEYNGHVFVDEAQFLTIKQVQKLIEHGEVTFFGLSTDFMAEEFTTSAYIRENAESTTIHINCAKCTNDAEYSMRVQDGKSVFEGEQVQIGAHFIGVCKNHYI